MNRYDKHNTMSAWRWAEVDKFVDEFKDFDMSSYQHSDIYCYNFMNEEMEFYQSLPDSITTLADAVDYVVKLQIDRGGCWRFEMEINDATGWFEVGEWYLDYDFYDPIR